MTELNKLIKTDPQRLGRLKHPSNSNDFIASLSANATTSQAPSLIMLKSNKNIKKSFQIFGTPKIIELIIR